MITYFKKLYNMVYNRVRFELRYRKNLKNAQDDDPYIYK